MRLLKRNLTDFEYLPYLGESDLDPDTGLHTGEPVVQYGDPVEYEGNISTPSLLANQTFYGTEIRYTHVLLMDDPDAEIDEYGIILWEGEKYEIRAIRRSLNVLSAALRKQTVNYAEDEPEEEEQEDEPDPEDGGEDGDEP